jgi:cation transporter-like permease
MFEAFGAVVVFVTVSVSFLYGARMAWHYGKKCDYKEKPETKKEILIGIFPAVTTINFFGFVILFHFFTEGFLTITLYALISAVLLSLLVVTTAIPELKRRPADYVEKDSEEEEDDSPNDFLR